MLNKITSAKQIDLKPFSFCWRVGNLRYTNPDKFVQVLVQISKWIELNLVVRRSLPLVCIFAQTY